MIGETANRDGNSAALPAQRALLVAADDSRDFVAVLDAGQRILFANRRLLRSLRRPRDAVIDRRLDELELPPALAEDLSARLEDALSSGRPTRWQFELPPGPRTIRARFVPVPDSQGRAVVLCRFRNISGPRRQAERLQQQAERDPLTGLLNRRSFEQALLRLIADARERQAHHVLCYLDLDNFKLVNDSCGHGAGDALLRQLPEVIAPKVRRGDCLARVGGDEFALLMADCSLEDAVGIAEEIRNAIRRFRFVAQSRTFTVGVSIGVVGISPSTEGAEQVLRDADTACYTAKDRGRNEVHVAYPNELATIRRRGELRWAERLARALESDALRLYNQPMLQLGGDRDWEYQELLLRLQDQDGEPILPGAFLPAAERHGLIGDIDRWVIRRGLAAAAPVLAAAGRRQRLSINIAGSSLTDLGLVDVIRDVLAAERIAPASICFELREAAASLNLGAALEFIRELRELGCGIALDDFGSGISSFSYLKNLPVDLIKIDGHIVGEMLSSPADEAIVRAINDVAHCLGIATAAKGVENQALLATLRNMGVDYAQGYAVALPQPFGSGRFAPS